MALITSPDVNIHVEDQYEYKINQLPEHIIYNYICIMIHIILLHITIYITYEIIIQPEFYLLMHHMMLSEVKIVNCIYQIDETNDLNRSETWSCLISSL